MDKITVVFTSCGRFKFLNKTITSFMKYNTSPVEKIIVIDNSTTPDGYDIIQEIVKYDPIFEIIINDENIGQVASIDKAYSLINTEYIFHCEDDWEFFDYNFIELSLDVLKNRPDISNVNIRTRFDNEKGSMHPITGEFITINNTKYHEYMENYCGVWHGFSWNPGLRRLIDYNSIKPYKQYGNEQGVNKIMNQLGFKAACLTNSYCKHIGTNSITPKSNT